MGADRDDQVSVVNPTLPRIARGAAAPLLLAACLLAVLAASLLAPSQAGAKVRLLASLSPTGEVKVTARTSRATKRIIFYLDGRKRGVRRSINWRHGRRGVINARGLTPGVHRVSAVAIHRRGRTSRGVRVIRLRRRSDRDESRISLKRAKEVAKPRQPKTSTAPPAGILFNGGFDNGFDSWHVQALDYRVGIFSQGAFHGSAAHFEVHQGDVEPETDSQRAEVSGPTFNEGQELFVRDTIRVSSSSTFDGSWQLVQQLREEDWGGSPGTAVFLEDDRQLKVGAGDSSPMFYEGPELEPDRWYDLVYRVKLSQDSSVGFVEVWLDGVPQQMVNGETRIYEQTMQRPQNYLKAGIYRSSSSSGASIVDHDNVIVGTSYEAVMAAG